MVTTILWEDCDYPLRSLRLGLESLPIFAFGGGMSFTRLLTATAALTVAATIANAADMPVKAPAAVPVVQQQASGYLEVYGGWASTEFRHTICNPGPACFQDPFDFD